MAIVSEMEKEIFEERIKPLLKKHNGKLYLLESSLDEHNFTVSERAYTRILLKKLNIGIYVETPKEKSSRVRDLDYGVGKALETEASYKGRIIDPQEVTSPNQVDYEKLDELIEDVIISKKINIIRQGTSVPYRSVRLSDLLSYKLSDEELEYVIEALYDKDIMVRGKSQDLSETVGYDYVTTYHYQHLPKKITADELQKLADDYYINRTDDVLHKICLGVMSVVNAKAAIFCKNHKGIELDDLKQEALTRVLEDTFRNYDPSKGRASTFLYSSLDFYFMRYLNEQQRASVRLPIHAVELVNKLKIVVSELEKSGEEVTLRNIARFADVPQEKVTELWPYIMNATEDIDKYDVLSTNPDPTAIQNNQSELRRVLLESLNGLTDRERDTLLLRFGVIDGRARTLDEVAREFGVSKERIRQVEAKALRKLRRPSIVRKLEDFYDAEETRSDIFAGAVFVDESDYDYSDANHYDPINDYFLAEDDEYDIPKLFHK